MLTPYALLLPSPHVAKFWLTLSTTNDVSRGERSARVYGEFVLTKRHAVVFPLEFGVEEFLELGQVNILSLDHLSLSCA